MASECACWAFGGKRREIRALIGTTVEQVGQCGTDRLSAQARASSQMTDHPPQHTMSEIAVCGRAKHGPEEISSAVGQLDRITQQNAQMVEAQWQTETLQGRASTLWPRLWPPSQVAAGHGRRGGGLVSPGYAIAHLGGWGREQFSSHPDRPAPCTTGTWPRLCTGQDGCLSVAFGATRPKVGAQWWDIPGIAR